jgi:hypothetical protein
MDFAAHMLETARHLIWMADMPMARQHAALRLEESQALHPMYRVLPDLIQRIRKERTDVRDKVPRHPDAQEAAS